MVDLQFAIPSRRRVDQCRRTLSMLPDATVFVAEEEHDDYLKGGIPEGQLQTHPNLRRLSMIRNWVNDHMGSEVVVQVDDDFEYVHAWAGLKARCIRDPAQIRAIAEATAHTAKDMDTGLFGWGNAGKPLYFRPWDPIKFTAPLGRALGVIGRQLRWDEGLVGKVDTDATLQAVLKWRVVLCDTRFYWQCGVVYGNKGGCQGIRTSDTEARDIARLKQKWGPYVDFSRKTKMGGTNNAIRVERRLDNLQKLL